MLRQLLPVFESGNKQEKERDEGALSESQSGWWEWDLTAAPFVKTIKLSAAACFIREKTVYVSHYHLCLTWFCLMYAWFCVRVFVCGWPRSGIAPNITAGPSDSAVIDSMSVILHCETSGAPRPAITWQKGAWANSMMFLGGWLLCSILTCRNQTRSIENKFWI